MTNVSLLTCWWLHGARPAKSLQFVLSWIAAIACFVVCYFGVLTVVVSTKVGTHYGAYFLDYGGGPRLLLLGLQFLRRGPGNSGMPLDTRVNMVRANLMEWYEAF